MMATKLERITALSRGNPRLEFKWLMPHFSEENLTSCFNELDGRKAVGIDGKTKEEYDQDLEENIQTLVRRMKAMAYKPEPVRQVLIPKGNGKHRPLGISNIEDKVVQSLCGKIILEAIYDPLFCDCSYGFRRHRSAHGAIRDTAKYLKFNNVKTVIDIDLENFFGTIRHRDLLDMLSLKIKDKTFLRYISRLLKAGTVLDGKVERQDVGLPQGSILSPVLANIYAHYVVDLWFEKVVPKHIVGQVRIFRYCDDFVVACTDTRDVDKIIRSLEKRLTKFGLTLNRDKTRRIPFNKYTFEQGVKQGSFDFLGFTFYLSKARQGGFTSVKVKTSKKTLREKLHNVKIWVKSNRFKSHVQPIWLTFCKKLQGHIVYFGVSNNGKSLKRFVARARRIFFNWMNRRSQKRSFNWASFAQLER
jgi:group II intron reverse transcriptase/maturase